MLILLGSSVSSVVSRWKSLLSEDNRLDAAYSVDEIDKFTTSRKYDIHLLHRQLVDLDCCSAIRKMDPDSRIFLLSDHPSPEEGLAFLKSGVVGYGNTFISPDRLREAVKIIGSGGVWLGQKVIQQLIIDSSKKASESISSDHEQRLGLLTRMESRVAMLVANGKTNLEIASELEIAERTVKAHLTAIYEKLHIANRLSLALFINQSRA